MDEVLKERQLYFNVWHAPTKKIKYITFIVESTTELYTHTLQIGYEKKESVPMDIDFYIAMKMHLFTLARNIALKFDLTHSLWSLVHEKHFFLLNIHRFDRLSPFGSVYFHFFI